MPHKRDLRFQICISANTDGDWEILNLHLALLHREQISASLFRENLNTAENKDLRGTCVHYRSCQNAILLPWPSLYSKLGG